MFPLSDWRIGELEKTKLLVVNNFHDSWARQVYVELVHISEEHNRIWVSDNE